MQLYVDVTLEFPYNPIAMSQATIENIIKEIESLSEEERDLLENRLAQIDEARWQHEAAQAREIARNAGIDQANIDQTIARLRRP
jgi:DNA-binding MarR family transcriptional regulator